MRPAPLLALCALLCSCAGGAGSTDKGDAGDASDADGDGFTGDEDCDEGDATVHGGATELCDGVDNDCDGTVDEDSAADAATWYQDADGDGYGDPATSVGSCTAPTGFVASGTDCDDANSGVNPEAAELCDGVDNNCDGTMDEDSAADATTWYQDADGDFFGALATATESCSAPTGFVASPGDCDDSDAAVNPYATESCDGVDNNCDGVIDDDAIDPPTWYRDADSDGYGDLDASVSSCDAPSGYTSDERDCDDSDAAVSPGADEECDEIDNNCDGDVDEGCPGAECDGQNTGSTYDDGVSMGGPDLMFAMAYTPTTDVSVDRIEVFTGEKTGDNTIGLWSDDPTDSQPLSMLSEGTWAMDKTDDWQGADLSECVALTAGTDYWIVWEPINGAQGSLDASGTRVSYYGSFDAGGTWNGPYSGYLKFRLFCCE